MPTTPHIHHAVWTATHRDRTFPTSQRELVTASLLARPDRFAHVSRTELTWPRA